MVVPEIDTLEFAQRIVDLINSGRYNSTYKFATLMAIIDICTENQAERAASLEIPIREIAHRVVAYYWRQSRPFSDAGILRQNQQRGQSIPILVESLRMELESIGISSADTAYEKKNPQYERLVRRIELTIAQQPLTHLQTPEGRLKHVPKRADFIFDASGLSKKMRRADFEKHGPIILTRGAPFALRTLAPLLKPAIENRWSAVVMSLNRSELDLPDISAFLFSPTRKSLARAMLPLRESQNDICFYCGKRLTTAAEIDHVIPWSRIPLDGVANLVLAHESCNNNKSDTLPIWSHVERALNRQLDVLKAISKKSRLPILLQRSRGAASGIYGELTPGTLLWRAIRKYEYFE